MYGGLTAPVARGANATHPVDLAMFDTTTKNGTGYTPSRSVSQNHAVMPFADGNTCKLDCLGFAIPDAVIHFKFINELSLAQVVIDDDVHFVFGRNVDQPTADLRRFQVFNVWRRAWHSIVYPGDVGFKNPV